MEDLSLIALCIVGGFVAGGINTFAGNGSAITLGILTEVMGLPGTLANGSNRIGVLAQCITSSYQLGQSNQPLLRKNWDLIVFTILGSIIGVIIAVMISDESFKFVYKYMMIVMLVVVLIKPDKWMYGLISAPILPRWLILVLFFILGIYGGFIQMGTGIFFLALMVLVAGRPIMEGNILKAVVIAIYTLIALLVFMYKGLVDWEAGIYLAIGQALAGWILGKYAKDSPYANKVSYYLLLIVIFIVIYRLFFI
jgi:hypothetical protein